LSCLRSLCLTGICRSLLVRNQCFVIRSRVYTWTVGQRTLDQLLLRIYGPCNVFGGPCRERPTEINMHHTFNLTFQHRQRFTIVYACGQGRMNNRDACSRITRMTSLIAQEMNVFKILAYHYSKSPRMPCAYADWGDKTTRDKASTICSTMVLPFV
jgi:hypothetical protein